MIRWQCLFEDKSFVKWSILHHYALGLCATKAISLLRVIGHECKNVFPHVFVAPRIRQLWWNREYMHFFFYLQVLPSVRLIFRLPFPPRIINEFEIESSRVESAWIGEIVIILYPRTKYSTPIMKIVFSLLIYSNRLIGTRSLPINYNFIFQFYSSFVKI